MWFIWILWGLNILLNLYYFIEKYANVGKSHPKSSLDNLLIKEISMIVWKWEERATMMGKKSDGCLLGLSFLEDAQLENPLFNISLTSLFCINPTNVHFIFNELWKGWWDTSVILFLIPLIFLSKISKSSLFLSTSSNCRPGGMVDCELCTTVSYMQVEVHSNWRQQ